MQPSLFGQYRISRCPGLGYVTGRDVETPIGASAFTSSLASFLATQHPSLARQCLPIADSQFALYRQFKHTLPSLRGIQGEDLHDIVHASPARGRKPARFDTVLFVEDLDVAENIRVKGARAVVIPENLLLTLVQAIVQARSA